MQREIFNKGVRYAIIGLPLAAIVGSSFLPLPSITRQLLVLACLIWFQVTILLGIFSIN